MRRPGSCRGKTYQTPTDLASLVTVPDSGGVNAKTGLGLCTSYRFMVSVDDLFSLHRREERAGERRLLYRYCPSLRLSPRTSRRSKLFVASNRLFRFGQAGA